MMPSKNSHQGSLCGKFSVCRIQIIATAETSPPSSSSTISFFSWAGTAAVCFMCHISTLAADVLFCLFVPSIVNRAVISAADRVDQMFHPRTETSVAISLFWGVGPVGAHVRQEQS